MSGSRIVKRLIITVGIIFGMLIFLLCTYDSHEYGDCEKISGRFNATLVINQGNAYKVQACGDGKGITGDLEKIKLSVYGPDGDLVAVRRFTANFLASINQLEYKPEGIEYWDDKRGPVIIQIPPTWIDWVWARIPVIDGIPPFYIEKKAIEQEATRAAPPRSEDMTRDPNEIVIPIGKTGASRIDRNTHNASAH